MVHLLCLVEQPQSILISLISFHCKMWREFSSSLKEFLLSQSFLRLTLSLLGYLWMIKGRSGYHVFLLLMVKRFYWALSQITLKTLLATCPQMLETFKHLLNLDKVVRLPLLVENSIRLILKGILPLFLHIIHGISHEPPFLPQLLGRLHIWRMSLVAQLQLLVIAMCLPQWKERIYPSAGPVVCSQAT